MTDANEECVNQIQDGAQWQEKTVKHLWFHILRNQIQSGEIARVGAVPWAVYCVIKSHTGMASGDAFPSTTRIAELIRVSTDTVVRSLKKLVECGLLSVKENPGRSHSYYVTEKIDIGEISGEPWATGERKYASLEFTQFVSELTRLAKTGSYPTDKGITINLVIQNITQGPHGTVKGVDYGTPDKPAVGPPA